MPNISQNLTIIGAGLPRTGTFGLRHVLNELSEGPCYHMNEVFAHRDHPALWREAYAGRPDWDRLFADYRATTDAPGCLFWRQLADFYPSAKLILTVRAAEDWYESFMSTVYLPLKDPAMMPPPARPALEMAYALFVEGFLGGRAEDRAHAIACHDAHNAAVRAAFGPERLLVYDVSAGWPPLCAFLGKPVPDTPYPHLNDRESTRQRIGLS